MSKLSKFRKIYILVLIISLFFSGIGYFSYARYVSEAQFNSTLNVAKWSIEVNNTDITPNTVTSFSSTVNWSGLSGLVKSGYIAPGMMGTTSIEIDPTYSQVAMNYYINIDTTAIGNQNIIVNNVSIGGTCSNSSYTTKSTCETAGATWTPTLLSKVPAGICSTNTYTTQSTCETAGETWTANTYVGYYKGSIDLPAGGDMTTSQIVNASISVIWDDLNTTIANASDTSTGVAAPSENIVINIVVEQKMDS